MNLAYLNWVCEILVLISPQCGYILGNSHNMNKGGKTLWYMEKYEKIWAICAIFKVLHTFVQA